MKKRPLATPGSEVRPTTRRPLSQLVSGKHSSSDRMTPQFFTSELVTCKTKPDQSERALASIKLRDRQVLSTRILTLARA